VTTQYVSEAEYCDCIGVMSEGELICVDTPGGLRKRAYGGDVVDVVIEHSLRTEYLHDLGAFPFVKQKPRLLDENSVRVIVEEASTAIPELIDFTRSRNVEVKSIEPFYPPFDDVFVHLVKQEEAS
jgi:ABC-2 type transport system ATP-binding protein